MNAKSYQALLFAKTRGRLWDFCDPLLAAFWRREFDLETPAALEAALSEAGLSVGDWRGYLADRAHADLASASERAERSRRIRRPDLRVPRRVVLGR